MKLNQLLETTVASMPDPGQEPFRSGRNEVSLEEMTAGGTSSGSVASVSKPLGKMHKRVTEETCESCDCPKSKCGCNESMHESSILQGIIEADLQETDFILNPTKGRRLKPGLLAKQIGTPNPADNVRIDIPLLIRLLEYAREDAGSDLDLHDLAEKLIMCGARGKVLTMRDYDKLVDSVDEGFNPEYDDEAGMADNNLETLRRAIDGIDEIIQPDDNLPEWCQEKIAIAKSSLINVWDYMKSEEDRMQGSDDDLEEDWQKTNRRDKTSGMSRKAVKQYRRENPGSKLQTAVTTKPSKLKKGSKAAKRRKSFCSRMRGMKKSRTSAKTARDPNSNINKALRRWNCESVEQMKELVEAAQNFIAEKKKTLRNTNPCWKGYHPVGTKQKNGRTVPNCVPGKADESVQEEKQRLDPKCWTGYKKQGTKMKGGVRVNNCVPKESVEEASSAAQQAAIAISMKKAGKKPKSVKEGTPVNVNALLARSDRSGTGSPWWAKAGDINYMGDVKSDQNLKAKVYFPKIFDSWQAREQGKEAILKKIKELGLQQDDNGDWFYPVHRLTSAVKHEITNAKYSFGDMTVRAYPEEDLQDALARINKRKQKP